LSDVSARAMAHTLLVRQPNIWTASVIYGDGVLRKPAIRFAARTLSAGSGTGGEITEFSPATRAAKSVVLGLPALVPSMHESLNVRPNHNRDHQDSTDDCDDEVFGFCGVGVLLGSAPVRGRLHRLTRLLRLAPRARGIGLWQRLAANPTGERLRRGRLRSLVAEVNVTPRDNSNQKHRSQEAGLEFGQLRPPLGEEEARGSPPCILLC
jgi:hypothetical protein